MDSRGKRWTVTALAVAALTLGGGLSGLAWQGTPATGAAHAHPAHIHVGTCAELDPNPTFMLADVAPVAGESGAVADAAAIPVERAVTTVDASLEELRTRGYAINIHQSAEDIATYIACGNLSGALADVSGTNEDGALIVGLGELNGSGHSGIATLTGQGDQTEVTVYLAEGLSGAATNAESAATGESEAVVDATVVDIKDFAYEPASVEIAVGSAVTWTNSDTVPHTATARDRAVLQSGTLNEGDDFSQTFAEPGSFDYFCEFHPDMKGTIVVR